MLELLALYLSLLGAQAQPAKGAETAAAERTTSHRTAVVVTLEQGELPALEALQTWFLVGGVAQRVLAVEKGPAEVVVVRDPSVQPVLDVLAKAFLDREMLAAGLLDHLPRPRSSRPWEPGILLQEEAAFVENARAFFPIRKDRTRSVLVGVRNALRRHCRLGDGASLRFISPHAAPVSRTVDPMNIFNLTPSFKSEYHGFLTFVERAPALPFVLRLADAVWLAGKELHDAGRRRAVLVLLDGESADGSLFATASVRETLENHQVPVFAWSFRTGPLTAAWSAEPMIDEAESAFDPQDSLLRFDGACAALQRTLAAQRVVWIEGLHPPWTIRLSTGVEGVHLTGRAPAVPAAPAAGATP